MDIDNNTRLLEELGKLVDLLQERVSVVVFGGLAVDGYHGKISREHSDVDLICRRRDIDEVRDVLKGLGYETELFAHPEYPELIYKMNTLDSAKTFGCQIVDELPENKFEISFWHFPRQVFSLDWLDPNKVDINGVTFPVVAIEFVKELKAMECNFYESLREGDRDRFIKRETKYNNCLHDLEILSAV